MSDTAALPADPFDLLKQIESRVQNAGALTAAGSSHHWVGLGVRVADRWLLMPQDDVREVITLPTLTRVPGAKPWLLGLANVRGNLLPVCDLRGLMDGDAAPPAPLTRNSRVLVYNSERRPAGFLVDEVAGYRQFTSAEQDPDAQANCGLSAQQVIGAFTRDGQSWVAVSLHRIVLGDRFVQAGAG